MKELCEELMVGNHILQVKARDGWWNEDPSPALLTFNIEESFDDEEDILPQADCSVCSNIKKIDPSSIFLFCSLLIWFTQRRIEIREPDVI